MESCAGRCALRAGAGPENRAWGAPSVRSYTGSTILDPGRAHPSGADLDEGRA